MTSYRDLESRAAKLRTPSAAACVTPLDVVLVEGDGAGGFLHSQLSQSVEGLAVGSSAWSLLLEPDGKLGHLVRVAVLASGRLAVVGAAGEAAAIAARIDRFRFRVAASVAIEPWTLLTGHAGPPPTEVATPLVSVLPGVPQWLIPGDSAPHAADEAEPGLPDALALVCSQLSSADVVVGMNPYELGRGMIDAAVSFTKGCYTGQELVARIDARGAQAPLRLCHFRGEGEIGLGEVAIGGEPAGELSRVLRDESSGVVWGSARIRRGVELASPQVCTVNGGEGVLSEFSQV